MKLIKESKKGTFKMDLNIDTQATSENNETNSIKIIFPTLLLITGLLLSSAMFIHYGLKNAPNSLQSLKKTKTNMASTKANITTKTQINLSHYFATLKTKNKKPTKKRFHHKVKWPELTVSGTMTPIKGTKVAAIINGQYISKGDEIEGAILLSIFEKGVVLEYEGETNKLFISDTLPPIQKK